MKDIYWILGLIIALLMAGALSLFASTDPDGLEKVAEDMGFLSREEGHAVMGSQMPDYKVLGISNSALASSLAGILGVIIVFGFCILIGKALRRAE
jgi:F420-0:gamma-glutamyl ligase-like protein